MERNTSMSNTQSLPRLTSGQWELPSITGQCVFRTEGAVPGRLLSGPSSWHRTLHTGTCSCVHLVTRCMYSLVPRLPRFSAASQKKPLKRLGSLGTRLVHVCVTQWTGTCVCECIKEKSGINTLQSLKLHNRMEKSTSETFLLCPVCCSLGPCMQWT